MNEEHLKKLFQKYLDNNCTPSEKKYLDELFDSYLEDTSYNGSNTLEDEITLESKLFEQVRESIRSTETSQEKIHQKKPKNILQVWAVAASVAVLLALGIGWYVINPTISESKDALVQNEPIARFTKAGEKKEIRLRDGSTVYLNSESKLSYHQNFGEDGTRRVQLEGEAFFEVKPDKTRPFIIESGTIVTEVTGTSFNIQAFQENPNIEVTVLTGSVDVSEKVIDNTIKLVPNTQALFNKKEGQLSMLEVDASAYVNWKNGILHFEEVQLAEVLKALERWYGVKFITEDLTLNNCTLTSTFNGSSIYEVMESIKFAKENIDYTVDNNTIKLKGFCNQ